MNRNYFRYYSIRGNVNYSHLLVIKLRDFRRNNEEKYQYSIYRGHGLIGFDESIF